VIATGQYGILRFEKHKGASAGALEAHHERKKETYASNPDVDTSRSKDNFHIIQPTGRYRQEINSRIRAAGCRTRKDSTRFVDTLITASPDFFNGKRREDIADYFRRAAEFLFQRVGKQNIISAVVHMDEKTPHLHLTFVPLTEDNRLSAKEILGNRASLSKWQDDFHAYMLAAYPDLERGESARETGRTHIPTRIFKQAVQLTKQAQKIQETLDSISPFNAAKKREEAMEMLHKWFPQMENFETYLKKYQAALLQLKKENDALVERAEANSAIRIDQRLEIGQLQSDLRKLQRFVDAIPPEMMEQLQAIRKQRRREQYREER
jgi:Plasmid recombination enzyme.